jgi:hypothetical protein
MLLTWTISARTITDVTILVDIMVIDTTVTGTHMMVTWTVAMIVQTKEMVGIITQTVVTMGIVMDCGEDSRTLEVRFMMHEAVGLLKYFACIWHIIQYMQIL